jgi:hypothetical protein
VLLRTAVIGLKLAARKREAGMLPDWHMVTAAATVCAFGAVLVMAH